MDAHIFFISVAALSADAAALQVTEKSNQVASIEAECGLERGTITVVDDTVRLQPSPGEDYDKVQCALELIGDAKLGKLGFVGYEADPNAELSGPLQYIAAGSRTEIAAVTEAAKTDGWVVTLTATSSNGTAIVQFESAEKMTFGQASKLIDRIWKKEFGDIAFGFAPQKLSDPRNIPD